MPLRRHTSSRLSTAIVQVRRRDWAAAILSGLIALAALVVGSANKWQRHATRTDVTLIISTVALVVFGVIATRRFAAVADWLIRRKTLASAGAAARLVVSLIGYLFVFFATLSVLDVSVERLLVGAGLAGVVLGIAAQQSLGNVFAGFVLLLARPFTVGDHVRIRSGALGGVFDGTVLAISLTYVTIQVDTEVLKFPNSAILAAAVGPIPTPRPSSPASTHTGAPPAGTPGSVGGFTPSSGGPSEEAAPQS